MSAPNISQQMPQAWDRFFAIDELVELFLHEADTLVLLNCQRVCRLWKGIIDQSQELQEKLFFTPVSSDTQEVILNPVLESRFNPLLACNTRTPISNGKVALSTAQLTYQDLERLPWARDGTDIDAPSRRAFSRKEASWRKMLVSQPPIKRLDWWHKWESEGLFANRGIGCRRSVDIVTIGTLWDWLESWLVRGSSVEVTFFPAGGFPGDGPPSFLGAQWRDAGVERCDPNIPRIRVRSLQVWSGEGPSLFQKFDVRQRRWMVYDEFPWPHPSRNEQQCARFYFSNGSYWLQADCANDGKDENWRWSRSDAFENVGLRSGEYHWHTNRIWLRYRRIEYRRTRGTATESKKRKSLSES